MPAAPPQAHALCDLSSWGWVKRKAFAKRRQYYLRLTGSVLSAHAAPKAPVEWDVSVLRAEIWTGKRRASLTVALASGSMLHLSFMDKDLAQTWADKLRYAGERSFDDMYKLEKKIGEGAFASVYRAVKRDTKQLYAVKKIRKKQFDMQMARELEREMYTMQHTCHSGIIRTHDVFNTQHHVFLVLDLMQGGTLKDNVQAVGGRIPEQYAIDIVRQVLLALEYLHSRGIVHRDIKLENVLCDRESIPVDNIRVADFGYVNFVNDHTDLCLRSLVGTPVYVAPEIVNRYAYGCPVDMYAVGVMLYRMLSGSYPYDGGDDDEETMNLAVQGRLTFKESAWSATSIMCKNFVRALLQPKPERRLTAKAALHHPWIEGATMVGKEELVSSPVTPYSDPPNSGRFGKLNGRIPSALLEDAKALSLKGRNLKHLERQMSKLDSKKISEESIDHGDDLSQRTLARARWRRSIFACMFLSKLSVVSGLRLLRPPRGATRRYLREKRHAGGNVPSSMRRRVVSTLSLSGRRFSRRNHTTMGTEMGEESVTSRMRRTFSYTRT